jgi:Leucine-rich repeat (LRR) protein
MLQTSVVKSLLQNLTKLRELHLDHIDMSSVSLSSFMNLSSSLTSLALKDCQLRGTLPDSIFRLPNLRELNLNDNSELKGLFPMVNWTNPLRFLDVSHTLFSGELPKSIGNLKFLSYLGLSSCNFSKSLPPTLGNLTQLTFFDLSYNNFSGEIPSSLSNLKALDYFDLHSNNLSGKISSLLLVGNA